MQKNRFTIPKEVMHGVLHERALFVAPKVGLEDMLDNLGRVALDHSSDPWQGGAPDRPKLVVHFLVEGDQLRARDGAQGEQVTYEREGARLLEIAARAGADSMRAVLVEDEEEQGESKFLGVGGGGVLGEVLGELSDGRHSLFFLLWKVCFSGEWRRKMP